MQKRQHKMRAPSVAQVPLSSKAEGLVSRFFVAFVSAAARAD
jgi:hypothetical protein